MKDNEVRAAASEIVGRVFERAARDQIDIASDEGCDWLLSTADAMTAVEDARVRNLLLDTLHDYKTNGRYETGAAVRP